MKSRAILFVVALIFVCGVSALPFPLPQGEAPSAQTQEQTPEPAQPPAQEPPQSNQTPPQDKTKTPQQSAPGPEQAAPPSTQDQSQTAPSEKSGVPPKPPVLRHKKHVTAKKTGGSASKDSATGNTTPNSQPEQSKVVVKNGGAKEQSPQIAPATSPDQAQHERVNTAQLLALTDANLKRVGARQLTSSEQGTLGQIHTYVRQAKAATAAGDTNRAQTLAYKARLLSDELARK
jgi:hypothetical protein